MNTRYYYELPPEGQYLIDNRRALHVLETNIYTQMLNDLNGIGLKELFARVFNLARVYGLKTYQRMVQMKQDVLSLDPDNEGDADSTPREITLYQNHYVHGPAPSTSRRQRSKYKDITVHAGYFTSLPADQINNSGTNEGRTPAGTNNLERRVRQAANNSGPCLVYSYLGIAQTYAGSIGAERVLLTEAEITAMLADPSIYDPPPGEGAQSAGAVIGCALRVLGIDTTNLNITVRGGEGLQPDLAAFATVRHVEDSQGDREPGHWQEGANTGELRWDPIYGTNINREPFEIRNIYIDERVRR